MAKSVLEQLVALPAHYVNGISRVLAAAGLIAVMSVGCESAISYDIEVNGAKVIFHEYTGQSLGCAGTRRYEIIERKPDGTIDGTTITYVDYYFDGLDSVTVSGPNGRFSLSKSKSSPVRNELFGQYQGNYSALLSLIKERMKQNAQPGFSNDK